MTHEELVDEVKILIKDILNIYYKYGDISKMISNNFNMGLRINEEPFTLEMIDLNTFTFNENDLVMLEVERTNNAVCAELITKMYIIKPLKKNTHTISELVFHCINGLIDNVKNYFGKKPFPLQKYIPRVDLHNLSKEELKEIEVNVDYYYAGLI